MVNTPTEQKKSILIDVTFLFDQYSKRGIGVYGRNVVKRIVLQLIDEEELEINLFGFLNLHQNLIALGFSQFQIEEIGNKVNFYTLGEAFPSSLSNLVSWRKMFIPIIEKVKPDIYFASHFERGLPSTKFLNRPLIHKPKTVVMAHDAIPLVLNKYSQKGYIQNQLKGQFFKFMWSGVRNADLVLTNSNFSKGDLVNYGKIDESKIKVIYLGIDKDFFDGRKVFNKDLIDATLAAYHLKDKNYFFYDSGFEANKSTPELLNVFKGILDLNDTKLPDTLVVTGGDFHKGAGKEIRARSILGDMFLRNARKLGLIENIVATDKVTENHLIELLIESKAYINLSSYEGFSFGPLQAMAARIPAIAANSSCTPEVTDGGAYLVDLEKCKDLESAKTVAKDIKELLQSKTKLANHLRMAQEIARKYNWDTTVNETLKEISKLVTL
ncbi:MAG: glycosyltransferase family 4 protein [Candidatus Dojkabacteria bacterium]